MSSVKGWGFANRLGFPMKPEIVDGDEITNLRLVGYVYGKKNGLFGEFEDGHRIITSPIKELNLEEGYVVTRSGSKYVLDGSMNVNYTKWLESGEGFNNIFEMISRLDN